MAEDNDPRTIHITVTPEQHRELSEKKGDRSWREAMLDDLEKPATEGDDDDD